MESTLKRQSASKNFIFQMIYQGLMLVIPLILSPYLTRTLQESALGTYTYINSIAYYFVIVANLGINVHGRRTISIHSNDPEALRKQFWSLYTLHAIISAIVIALYFGIIGVFAQNDRTIYIIEALYVASALFDVTWLYYGLENFTSVVVKNAVIKILECVAIFCFVKTPNDLSFYTLICATGIFLGQAVMVPQTIKIVKPIRFKKEDLKQHIKPLLLFSVAVFATTLYTVFDKTLLGIMTTKENVAFYEYSNKIINIPLSFVSVIGLVILPKACRFAKDGKIKEQKKYLEYSFLITAFIGAGSLFGLLAVADQFVVFYYGEAFQICGKIIKLLAPLVYIIGTGSVLRSQCLIPNGMDKQFNMCIVYNAIINLILSCSLIPMIGIYGAIIGTISAELFGFAYQLWLSRKFVNMNMIFKTLVPFVVIGMIMYIAIRIFAVVFDHLQLLLLWEFIIGAVIYCIFSLIYLLIIKQVSLIKVSD